MGYFLGVDPGWADCGWCLLGSEGDRVTGGVIHPNEVGIEQAVHDLITNNLGEFQGHILGASLERYVYYKGIHNPNSEQILMVTGAIRFAMYDRSIPFSMYKAIDWKNKLSRYLFKKGFRNPSDKLDKEFSLAAGEFCTGYSFSTDHEADAACLATMALLSHG